MQRLEVSGAVRPIYGSLGVKRLIQYSNSYKGNYYYYYYYYYYCRYCLYCFAANIT